MALSKKIRFEVLRRDNFTCQYCGAKAPDVRLNVDHIVPVSRGGGDEMSNLRTACFDCNIGKFNRRLNDDAEKLNARFIGLFAVIASADYKLVVPVNESHALGEMRGWLSEYSFEQLCAAMEKARDTCMDDAKSLEDWVNETFDNIPTTAKTLYSETRVIN